MRSIRTIVTAPALAAALAAASLLSPHEALATSPPCAGCSYADNIQLDVTNRPPCMSITTETDDCACLSRIELWNKCEETFRAQDFNFGDCAECTSLPPSERASILLVVDKDPQVTKGDATFTAQQGDQTVIMNVTYDIVRLPPYTPPPSSGCAAAGASSSSSSWLLLGAGALALAFARRRSRRG